MKKIIAILGIWASVLRSMAPVPMVIEDNLAFMDLAQEPQKRTRTHQINSSAKRIKKVTNKQPEKNNNSNLGTP